MKNIITTSKKRVTASIATVATLSMLVGFVPLQAAAENPSAAYSPNQYNNNYSNKHAHKGHKYRSHKKHYKRQKRAQRARKLVPSHHNYNAEDYNYKGNTYKHRRKRSGHYD
ncbi:MAG: hypothetical protein ABJK39_06195 [Hyphomicrobiales bacterium]